MVSGREVAEGEVLGAVGNYGRAPGGTTYHLHFDAQVPTRDGWVFVNPYMTLVAAYERLIGARGQVVNDAMFATAPAPVAADGQAPGVVVGPRADAKQSIDDSKKSRASRDASTKLRRRALHDGRPSRPSPAHLPQRRCRNPRAPKTHRSIRGSPDNAPKSRRTASRLRRASCGRRLCRDVSPGCVTARDPVGCGPTCRQTPNSRKCPP
jgi:hypothetical protein